MGNVYRVGLCPKCKEPIELEDTVMVHEWKNLELAKKMLKRGKSMEEVKKEFCGQCGGDLSYGAGYTQGCGCEDPSPQA